MLCSAVSKSYELKLVAFNALTQNYWNGQNSFQYNSDRAIQTTTKTIQHPEKYALLLLSLHSLFYIGYGEI